MLPKRSQVYEIRGFNNGGSSQVGTSRSTSTSNSTVHSNSFNFSRSSITSIPTNKAILAPVVRRSLRSSKQPKMGVPVMTSTPAPRTIKPTEEEPIYCEIPSPCKGPRTTSSASSTATSSALQLQRGQPLRSSNSRLIPAIQPHGGLGRRAITQLDISPPKRPPLMIQNSSRHADKTDLNKYGFHPGHQYHHQRSQLSPLERQQSMEVNLMPEPSEPSTNGSSFSTTPLLKGVLWQQREKRFSRWKERFFLLNCDYLQCFRKGNSKISEMGSFIFRVRLCEIQDIELVERRGYLTIRFNLPREGGTLLLRKTEGIRKWHQTLQDAVTKARSRRSTMRSPEEFWSKRQHTDSSAMESWVLARQRVGQQYCWSDTGSCISETASTTILPNHIRTSDFAASNPQRPRNDLETTSAIVGRKSYNNLKTTHYGLIDWPVSPHKDKVNKLQKESLVNNSHDSGVDSMNTNSSGSMMSSSGCSRQKSPMLDAEKFARQITLV